MWRGTFNGIVVLSLTLFVATTALWIRSYSSDDTWLWSGSKGEMREIALEPGRILFATAPWCGRSFEHLTSYDPNKQIIFSRRWSSGRETRFGIGFDQWTESILIGGFQGARPANLPDPALSRNLTVSVLTIRFPLLLMFFSIAPLCFAATHLRVRRIRSGFCAACGYDLRATPNRCPECGTAAGQPPDA
jgi:hypothetical protein